MAPENPHDALFRALLDSREGAASLIRAHLRPELATRLADVPPEPVDGTFVDAELRNSQSDRLFRVVLKNGRPAFIYVLLEHKSAPDPATPLQLLRYMARIWEQHGADPRRLPPIFPMVIYHGGPRWTVATSVVDALDADPELRALLRDLRYEVRDLARIEDQALAQDLEMRSGLMALKYAFRREGVTKVGEILRGLRDGSLLETQVMYYIANVFGELTVERLRSAVRQVKPGREDEMVSLAAQEWMREGEARGKALGEAEAKAEAVLTVLRARFGEPGPEIAARVRRLPRERLDDLLQRAATAESLNAVLSASED